MSYPVNITSHVLSITLRVLRSSMASSSSRISSENFRVTTLEHMPKFRSERRCRSPTKNGILTGYLITCGEKCHSVITYSSWNRIKAVDLIIDDYVVRKKVMIKLGKYVLPPLLVSAPKGVKIKVDGGALVFPSCASDSYPPPQVIPLMGVPRERPFVKPLYVKSEVIFLVSGLKVEFSCPDQEKEGVVNHALVALDRRCVVKVKGREMSPKRFVKDFRVIR